MTPTLTRPLRVATYSRVSTTDQDASMQTRELREYAAARGWEIVAEYVDTGWSGTKASRPELDALRVAARKRFFDCVIVYKLDRWGRSVMDSLASIQELTALGVRWIAITQGLDTDASNPMSRFMLTIMAAFAEMEREVIRERVMSGLANAKAKGTRSGKAIGRPTLIVDRQRLRDMRDSGMSYGKIAKEMGMKRSTVVLKLKKAGEPRA